MHREGLSLLDVSFNKIYLAKVIKLILPIMFLFIYLYIRAKVFFGQYGGNS